MCWLSLPVLVGSAQSCNDDYGVCVHNVYMMQILLFPYSSDHSFTRQNISMVTATVGDGRLAGILQVPSSIQDEIRGKTSTSADFREGAIEYYIQYSPQATWCQLAGQLYFEECGEALAAARRFIKRAPGKCVYIYLYPVTMLLLSKI